ncbi:NUPR2 [Branchiostoma lanceolatum]|uniref:NUPR2 protein n=1 Tax=Branchiostoma lanceolatum TaxID=7740 RepID=A0A8J9ZXF3_BRALA|nr:NUPR2 [Branchiostoma lanceolatum]
MKADNGNTNTAAAAEYFFDEYEYYNFDDYEKLFGHSSGKGRTRREADLRTNRHDPNGHVRKIVTKMQNTEKNRRQSRKK